MSGGPLASNPAASAELTARYSKLFLDYKLAVNGAHFSGTANVGGAGGAPPEPLWTWQGPGGIRASDRPPLLTFLAAPRLPAELQQYVQQPQQQQQQQ